MTGKTKKGRERLAHASAGTSSATMNRAEIERALARLSKERDDLRRDTMTGDEVAGSLDVSSATVAVLAQEGIIDRQSHGRYERKSVEAFLEAVGKKPADPRRDTMTLGEGAGYLKVSIVTFLKLAKEGKIDRPSHGRYDRESVKAVEKELRDAMTRDEVAAYLNISTRWVDKLGKERKIDSSAGGYNSKSVKAFAKALEKEHGDLRGAMTSGKAAGCLDVSIGMVEKWAREGKIARRPLGRFDGKSVKALKAFAKAFAKERADLLRDTMTRDEVTGSLDLSISEFYLLVNQGKIERRSPGRYDRKSVEAFAKVLADLRRDTMSRKEAADCLGSFSMVTVLAMEGKIERRPHGRYDRKSVEAFADTDNT